jgi:hypothetical protein
MQCLLRYLESLEILADLGENGRVCRHDCGELLVELNENRSILDVYTRDVRAMASRARKRKEDRLKAGRASLSTSWPCVRSVDAAHEITSLITVTARAPTSRVLNLHHHFLFV